MFIFQSFSNLLFALKQNVSQKLSDDSGIGVIEIILILLVLVGLVLIFKDQITALARSIFSNINSQAGEV